MDTLAYNYGYISMYNTDAHTLDWRIQCNLWVMFWADIHLSNMSSSEQQRSAYVSSLDL